MSAHVSTLLDALRVNTERHPDKILFAFLDVAGRITRSFSYEEFEQTTADIASLLHHTHRIRRGERVLLVYPPGLDMVCALYACARLGVIPVPAYPPSSHGFATALEKLSYIAEDCGAMAVLTDGPYAWSFKLHGAQERLSTLFSRQDRMAKIKWIVTSDAEPGARRDFPESPSDILLLQYTSGSTSEPKGVIVSHRNVLSNCDAVVDHVPVGVSWLPQYHDMGLIGFYLFVAARGGTTYGMSPIDFTRRPFLWLDAMSRYRASASSAPNFAYEYCLQLGLHEDAVPGQLDLSSLRLLMNGAEPVRPDVHRNFLRRFKSYGLNPRSFVAAYGLAENTLAVAVGGRRLRRADGGRSGPNGRDTGPLALQGVEPREVVSCGRPAGSTVVKIVSDTAREVPEGSIGEVWVSGPSKCLGYWGRPELTRETFEAHLVGDTLPERTWLRTGDLGFVRDGELFVCGRAKDVIIVRGVNHYPQDIEAIVEEDPAIRSGRVAAVPSSQDGREGVVVIAELRSRNRRADVDALNRRIQQSLGIGVDTFLFIPKHTIPKTSSGKICRREARKRWRSNRFEVLHQVEHAGPVVFGSSDGIAALFRRHGLTGTEPLPLGEIGLDSLATAQFAAGLEDLLEGEGAKDLAAGVDIRWLQKIAVSDLFDLLRQLRSAAPQAKVRFRYAVARLRREYLDMERAMMRRDVRIALDAFRPSMVQPRAGIRPAGILLTGGTGFFGPFLLWSLLQQCDDPVYVMTRAGHEEHARSRILEGLESVGPPIEGGPATGWRDRVIPICGDLSQPSFGLSASEWKELCEDVHTVYHNGALVNYLLDYDSMRASNVGGTKEVLRLAMTGASKVVNHISTTFVFGWSTKETLFETYENAEMALLDFGYSQSKWVSEQLVLAAMRQGMPGRVFRPALISPSVHGGGHNFDIAIRLLAFMVKHGITTTAANQVSFTPADVIANNIVAIGNLPDTVGKTFHVTRDDYSSLLDVTEILAELTGTRFTRYPLDAFIATIIERCREDDLVFPLLNFLVHSVENISAMEFKRYDSGNYREARDRSPAGRPDAPLEDVVMGIVRFMAKHDIIEVPQ